jgi:hypothetical protein
VKDIEDNWFRFFSVAAPLRLFCVPRHIQNDAYFDETNRKAGLVFDRARIALIAECEAHHPVVNAGAHVPLDDLVKLVVDRIGVAAPRPLRRRRKAEAAQRSR